MTRYTRNWRGDIVSEVRPGNVSVAYARDVVGNLVQRLMPGGLSEEAQYDSAGRIQWSKLTHNSATTRLVTYGYHHSNHPCAGMLNTTTDARNIVKTYQYDEALRLRTVVADGPDPEDDSTRTFAYNERDLAITISETGINVSTQVSRRFDGYGQIATETVYFNGSVQSHLVQHFDAAGPLIARYRRNWSSRFFLPSPPRS